MTLRELCRFAQPHPRAAWFGGCHDPLVLPNPIGFVPGGGGSLGAAQVGMLRALAGAGIVPDLVTGTSVGSLNGTGAYEASQASLQDVVIDDPGLHQARSSGASRDRELVPASVSD